MYPLFPHWKYMEVQRCAILLLLPTWLLVVVLRYPPLYWCCTLLLNVFLLRCFPNIAVVTIWCWVVSQMLLLWCFTHFINIILLYWNVPYNLLKYPPVTYVCAEMCPRLFTIICVTNETRHWVGRQDPQETTASVRVNIHILHIIRSQQNWAEVHVFWLCVLQKAGIQ
jgi:energy-coupling factor transporter transmembrane protein EcfT